MLFLIKELQIINNEFILKLGLTMSSAGKMQEGSDASQQGQSVNWCSLLGREFCSFY